MFDALLCWSKDITGVLVLLIFFFLVGYRPPWRPKNTHGERTIRDIPGPRSIPVFGTYWLTSFIGGYAYSQINDLYKDLFAKYGPIMKLEVLCNIPLISIVKQEDIEKVFKSSGKYPLRPRTEAVAIYRMSRPDRYSTMGLVNEQGPAWQKLRSCLATELTSPGVIAGFLPEMQQIADDWCNLIKVQCSDNSRIEDVKAFTVRLGLEATCALVLGRRMGFLLQDGLSQTATELAAAVNDHFIACRDTYYGVPFWVLFKTPAYKRLVHGEERIYDLVQELIASADESTQESVVFQSVLKAPLEEKEKIAAIVDFISAGIYTLSNTLVFLLHLMGEHPLAQKQLLKEVEEGTSAAYVRACVNEAFRMYTTATPLGRILEKDLELCGHKVKAGTVVLCHTDIACHSEENFSEANKFRPERWLGAERLGTMSAATYLVIPFGHGRRVCPGRRFVEQAVSVVLLNAVQNFSISCPESLKVHNEFLQVPKGAVPMIFENRVQ